MRVRVHVHVRVRVRVRVRVNVRVLVRVRLVLRLVLCVCVRVRACVRVCVAKAKGSQKHACCCLLYRLFYTLLFSFYRLSSCLNFVSNLFEYASKSLAATANFSTLSVTASICVKNGSSPSSVEGCKSCLEGGRTLGLERRRGGREGERERER